MSKLNPDEARNAEDFEKLDNETEWGPPWSITIRGSNTSWFFKLEDTNIASKGFLAPTLRVASN